MSTNQELVKIFNDIADLLDLGGEKFKPEAYRRAARSIESLSEDIRRVSQRGELETIPGVGAAISEKIREYLKDGTIAYHDRLRAQFPQGILDLMRLPGLGPKTARRFLVELGIEGPAELSAAIAAGRLTGVKGIGPRKIELLTAALASAAAPGRRTPLAEAFAIASRIVQHLTASSPLEQIEVAGSLRRRREDVGDIDILATSKEPEKVFDAFTALPGGADVKLRGGTKETIVVAEGLQVDLRVVEPAAFGAALQYFTGSKDHNVRLRTIARDLGLKVNEYGVFRGEERVAGATEEEVYTSLGLAWVPPEIRENQGEVEAAQQRKLPRLVEPTDLRGDLHVHLGPNVTDDELAALVQRARARSLAYLGVVLEAPARTGPTTAPEGTDVVERLRALGGPGPAIHVGIESPVPLTLPESVEYWIWRPGAAEETLEKARALPPALVAHGPAPNGTTLAWLRPLAEAGVPVDVGPEGPSSSHLRPHLERGGRLHLSTMALGNGFDLGQLAVGLARRAWATREQVANASAKAPLPPAPTVSGRSGRRRS